MQVNEIDIMINSTCNMSFLLAMSFFHSGTDSRGMIGCRREYIASLQ